MCYSIQDCEIIPGLTSVLCVTRVNRCILCVHLTSVVKHTVTQYCVDFKKT